LLRSLMLSKAPFPDFVRLCLPILRTEPMNPREPSLSLSGTPCEDPLLSSPLSRSRRSFEKDFLLLRDSSCAWPSSSCSVALLSTPSTSFPPACPRPMPLFGDFPSSPIHRELHDSPHVLRPQPFLSSTARIPDSFFSAIWLGRWVRYLRLMEIYPV